MSKSATLSTKCALCALLMLMVHLSGYGQKSRLQKVQALYDSIQVYNIQAPHAVLATAIYETGWLECRDCSLQMNNLFGFRLTNDYIQFANISECLAYMKKWQELVYEPWRVKHPNGSYYQFLHYVKYAQDMPEYTKNIRSLERWVKLNMETPASELSGL